MFIIHVVHRNGNKPIDGYSVCHRAIDGIMHINSSKFTKAFPVISAEIVESKRKSRFTSAIDIKMEFNTMKGLYGAKDLKALGVL